MAKDYITFTGLNIYIWALACCSSVSAVTSVGCEAAELQGLRRVQEFEVSKAGLLKQQHRGEIKERGEDMLSLVGFWLLFLYRCNLAINTAAVKEFPSQ